MNNRIVDLRQLPGTEEVTVVDGQGYFPVITRSGGEGLVVALRGGAPHMGLGGRLDSVASDDGGRSWSAPVTVADSERDDRNPALGTAADGTLVLAYHWQGNYDADGNWKGDGSGPTDTRVVRSRDGGRSWGEDRFLDWTAINGASPFGKIRCDAGGRLYMPIYGGPPEAMADTGNVSVSPAVSPTYLLRSDDDGESWGQPLLVARGLNEADVLLLADDDWLFAARSASLGETYTCRSVDQGHTWGELQRVTVAREHPPDLTDLGDGVVLLTYGRRHEPFGVDGRVSLDGGRSWAAPRLQLATDLPGTDIGYPSTARLDDGWLVTAYYVADKRRAADGSRSVHACCRALRYREEELLAAL